MGRARSEQRVDERGDGGALDENDQSAKDQKHEQYRDHPEFLADAEKSPELSNDRHHDFSRCPLKDHQRSMDQY